jgi:HEAT repeat protein
VATEIREILEQFSSGVEEEAFFELLESPGDVLPAITTAFRTEHNPALRALLVKVAWERRDPKALHLLTEALNQTDEKVWQAALDGLVTFASPEALVVLRAAKPRDLGDEADTQRFQLFVREAIEYICQTMPS